MPKSSPSGSTRRSAFTTPSAYCFPTRLVSIVSCPTRSTPSNPFMCAMVRLARHSIFAHVGDRLIIDDVIAVTGTQQFEEVEAALGIRRAKPGEVLVADLGAEAVDGLVASPGVVNRDPRRSRARHAARHGTPSQVAPQTRCSVPRGDGLVASPPHRCHVNITPARRAAPWHPLGPACPIPP
jgi:hypothetical protein